MSLPPNHFLNLARSTFPGPASTSHAFDISTVAAADYDVDVRTGFMPPHAPLSRLPEYFNIWEDTLDRGLGKLKLATAASAQDLSRSEKWRQQAREMPILSTSSLHQDEISLRRAHVVLTYMMHLYVHSALHPDPTLPISIPAPISRPLLIVSKQLGLLPILTYADTVLWNWTSTHSTDSPSPNSIRTRTSFTGTSSEDHFYLTSAYIELRGVEALSLMRSTLDETFLGDSIAVKRVAEYLGTLAVVIDDISRLLMQVREGCDPSVFYNEIRPWFNGGKSHPAGWHFEGAAEEGEEKYQMLEGPSAGQSSLIHALDVFLGVDHARPNFPSAVSPSKTQPSSSSSLKITTPSPRAPAPPSDSTFLERQKQYMPRHHRLFLDNLGSTEQPVRAFVERQPESTSPSSSAAKLKEAYNGVVLSLKRFRDGHVRIATIYIITQARAQAVKSTIAAEPNEEKKKRADDVANGQRGTGGTLLIPFLKGARDNTLHTILRK